MLGLWFLNVNCVRPPSVCLQAVHTLISLQKRYLDSLGRLSPAEEDTIWQVIIGQRAQVSLYCPSKQTWRHCVNLLIVTPTDNKQLQICLNSLGFYNSLCPDRLMTDKMNASVLSPPGSMLSSCVKQQQRQHTRQVCKRTCQSGYMAVWLNRLRQVFSGL